VSRLPVIGWRRVTAALEKAGFVFDRQKGSHMVYYHPQTNHTVVVPKHRVIKKGMLREIIKGANLTREEFLDLLK
jgi:predicted RNA binding protein YcfA (HicA-like mRNA interferase family)